MWQGIGSEIGLATKPTDCSSDFDKVIAAHASKDGLIRKLVEPPKGMYRWPDGHFSNVPPPDVQLAEVREGRCFRPNDNYSVGDRGLHSVTEPPRHGISLPDYLAHGDAVARRVGEASSAERDRALVDYFKSRKSMGEVIHRFFGDPGLQVAFARYAGPEHQSAIALLRERVTDPGFASALSPLERAELELLAAAPEDFISCTARHGQKKG